MNATCFEWVKWLTTLITTIVGGGFAAWKFFKEWRKQNSIRRANFVYEIMQDLRYKEEDIKEIRYKIEYGRIVYKWDDNFHGNSDVEPKIDKYLSLLNYICYLRKTLAINRKDFNVFRYSIVWTLTGNGKVVQAYLWNLYHFAKLTNGSYFAKRYFYLKNRAPCSFQYLINWGLCHRLFVPNFKSPYCSYFVGCNMDCQKIAKRATEVGIAPRRKR